MARDDSLLLDILLAARTIVRYTASLDSKADFADNQMLQDAVMRQIQIIGEAASQISPATREAHPKVPWRAMAGMRHRLVHDYGRIDVSRIWETARRSVPDLITLIEPVVPPPAEDEA